MHLTRREARALRGAFRRAVLGIPRRGANSPLVLRADGAKLRAQHRYTGLVVEYVQDAPGVAPEAVALPPDALREFEGRDDTPVALEAVAPDRTVVRWSDRGIPQSREYEVVPVDRLAPFPEPPAEWSDAPPGLPDALAEAAAIACHGSTRYALGCVQIRQRDGGHEVIATDGCKLLIRGGFTLPWDGDVLVNRTPPFGSRALRDGPLSLGCTETHVVFRAGARTVTLEVREGDRFPDVDRALPAAGTPLTRLTLDPDDAVFLGAALDRLPGGDAFNTPVTVDLNGRVAVRARGTGGVTETAGSPSALAGRAASPNSCRADRGTRDRPCASRSTAGSWAGRSDSGSTCRALGAVPTPWSAATPSASTPGSRCRPRRRSRRPRTPPAPTPSGPLRAGRTGVSLPRTKGGP
jgi:hypothetical protein